MRSKKVVCCLRATPCHRGLRVIFLQIHLKKAIAFLGSFKFKYNLNSGNVGMCFCLFVFCEEKRKLRDF